MKKLARRLFLKLAATSTVAVGAFEFLASLASDDVDEPSATKAAVEGVPVVVDAVRVTRYDDGAERVNQARVEYRVDPVTLAFVSSREVERKHVSYGYPNGPAMSHEERRKGIYGRIEERAAAWKDREDGMSDTELAAKYEFLTVEDREVNGYPGDVAPTLLCDGEDARSMLHDCAKTVELGPREFKAFTDDELERFIAPAIAVELGLKERAYYSKGEGWSDVNKRLLAEARDIIEGRRKPDV